MGNTMELRLSQADIWLIQASLLNSLQEASNNDGLAEKGRNEIKERYRELAKIFTELDHWFGIGAEFIELSPITTQEILAKKAFDKPHLK